MADIASAVSLLANVTTGAGLVWAVFLYRREQQRLRRERQVATHTLLNARYAEYLRLCFDNPGLHIHDYEPPLDATYTDEQRRKRVIAFEMLVTLFELAYTMYEGHTDDFRRAQWRGWERYIGDWCRRPDFLRAWDDHLGAQYDSRFMRYMDGEIAAGKAAMRAADQELVPDQRVTLSHTGAEAAPAPIARPDAT